MFDVMKFIIDTFLGRGGDTEMLKCKHLSLPYAVEDVMISDCYVLVR